MPDGREHQLVNRVRRGDQAALGELLQMHQQRLFNVCLRMLGNRDDAAETCQDAMLKVVEHFHDYNGHSALSTWMIRICMNLSISQLRKRRLRRTVSIEAEGAGNGGDDQGAGLRRQLADDREPTPEQCVQKNEMIEHLHKAMQTLEDDFRAVLVLRDIDQMDYRDIAEVLGVPVGTVKSRLFRARLSLRQLLAGAAEAPAAPGTPAASPDAARIRSLGKGVSHG